MISYEFPIQARRSGVVPSITDGNPLHDPLHQAQRWRRQGRVHEVAVHDHTPLGRVPERKMDPWGSHIFYCTFKNFLDSKLKAWKL